VSGFDDRAGRLRGKAGHTWEEGNMSKKVSNKEIKGYSKLKFKAWSEEGVAPIVKATSRENWAKIQQDIAFLLRCATRVMIQGKQELATSILKDEESSDALKTLQNRLASSAELLQGMAKFMSAAEARLMVAGAHACRMYDKRAKKAA
jgi:hypothetical protein